MNMPEINAQNHVAPGTGLHLFIGWAVLVITFPILFLFSLLVSYGLALFAWIWWVIHYTGNIKRAHAQLRGSALHVTETQLPQYHQLTHTYAQRLGLSECPEVYIIENNQQNAMAMKFGSRKAVVLMDDLVYGSLATGNERAIAFIIAHELAHHALGHTGFFRSLITSRYKTLSRLDEFSCDAVAHALVGDLDAAKDAFCLLLVGPQLFAAVARAALDQQALEVTGNPYSKKSERPLTHPLLLRRYAALVHNAKI
jgi:Zn-dependent protease with chaperone function